eukprot:scaffold209315_cov27-Cyclotella_meneghiniana.AAC.1
MDGLEPSKSKNLLAQYAFHGRGVGCAVLCAGAGRWPFWDFAFQFYGRGNSIDEYGGRLIGFKKGMQKYRRTTAKHGRVMSISSEEMELRYSYVSPHVEQDELVYVAGSMRGDCFHSTSTCHGLRSSQRGSNGVTTITKQGASMRNVRPCQLCKPSSITDSAPSKLHLVQNERNASNQLVPESSRFHLVSYEGRVSKSSNQLVPTHQAS